MTITIEIWVEERLVADAFICRDCEAGSIEPDNPAPIGRVRPYWLVPDRA